MISGFFDNTEVLTEDFARFAAGILTNGVIADVETSLLVTAPTSGMKVNVAPGYAWINGHFGKNEESTEVDVTMADSTYPRRDRVIVRLDFNEKTVSLTTITGEAAANPQPPELVRTGTIYDLGLALLTIPAGTLNITDEMVYDTRRDPTVCGGVYPRMSEAFIYPGANNFGDIKITACATPPLNWLLCDGSAISRTHYADLFAAIGTTYGAGNGTTTFNLPDLRGRTVFGKADSTFTPLGATGGSKTKTLSINEMPSHNHSVNIDTSISIPSGPAQSGSMAQYYSSQSSPTGASYNSFTGNVNGSTGSRGGGASFSILPPYITLNYIIYAGVN